MWLPQWYVFSAIAVSYDRSKGERKSNAAHHASDVGNSNGTKPDTSSGLAWCKTVLIAGKHYIK
jgi:hypothetical protein